MIIGNNFYRIGFVFFKKEDFEKRNMWVSKFKGIQRDSKAHNIKAIFNYIGGMNYYWRNKENFVNDDNLYVEFKQKVIYWMPYIKTFIIKRLRSKALKEEICDL